MCLEKPIGHGFNSHHLHIAAVAELVDALDLKSSCGDTVRVRFPPAAHYCLEFQGID